MTRMETATDRSDSPTEPYPKFGDDVLLTLARFVLAAALAVAAGYAAASYAASTSQISAQAASVESAGLPAEWRWERADISFDGMQRSLRDSPVNTRR